MSNTYAVRNSRKVLLRNIAEERRWKISQNVTLHGRGAKDYAFDRNQNLVFMLENFAGSPAPSTPIDGQLWWDIPTAALRVWNAAGSPQLKWDPVVPDPATVGFRINAGQGLKYGRPPVVGSPPGGALPTGSPLTIELEVGTGGTTIQNFVVVNASGSSSDNRIFTSQDGITWTKRTHAVDNNHDAITYSPTLQRFIVVHRTRNISYSDDAGETWTLETNAFPVSGGAGPNYFWEYVNWIDALGMFIAGNDSTDVDEEKIAYSSDGLTWTLADTVTQWPTRPQAPITSDFIWVDTLGVVVAGAYSSNNDPHAGNVVWSYDGITWTYVQDAIGATEPFAVQAAERQALVWSDDLDKLYAVAGTGSNSTFIRVYEYDTSSVGSPLFGNGQWTSRGTNPPWGQNGVYRTAIYAGGSINKLIFVGEGSDDTTGSPDPDKYNLITSTDGVSWKGHMLGSRDTGGGGTRLYGVTYSEALDRVTAFSNNTLATGSPLIANVAWYSDDGNNWIQTTLPVVTSTNLLFYSAAAGESTLSGINVAANSISIDESTVNHDSLAGFVSTEHTNHANVVLSGSGMLSIGDLTVPRTVNVGGGDGITANANHIQVDSSVVRTTGTQGISGIKTFTTTGSVRAPDGTAAQPGIAFYTDTDNGMYLSASNTLGFSTAGVGRFIISPDGVLTSLNANYETLVTEDDDIPNKKYVDDLASAGAGGPVTDNTFSGINFISGLTPGKKYLVGVYGTLRNNGTGTGTHGAIRITQTAGNPPIAGLLYMGPLHYGINWPDGNTPQFSTAVITAPGTGIIYGYTDYRDNTPPAIEYRSANHMTAVQLD